MRASGILLPISSLPTRYGIGGFSKEAYEFVDHLAEADQAYWQVLPMGPVSFGDSPYASFSTFAGNPFYISLDTLKEEGLLTQDECNEGDCGLDPRNVNYIWLRETRDNVLYKAFQRFEKDEAYEAFLEEEKEWLEDYVLYRALKNHLDGVCWDEWPEELKMREKKALEEKKKELAKEMDFYRFIQYKFYSQWEKLKAYANEKGIQIIGDIPIYVAYDSSDVWAEPALFQFDKDLKPKGVAGCPPDAFSATGQMWGNPLYDWKYHKKTGYAWWIRRMAHCNRLYDVTRLDHFRGFDEYYFIPAGEETAINGHWEKGPGMELFRAMEKKLGKLHLIAEDLGFLTPSVRKLLKESGFPGMKVLQFAFDGGEVSDYLPHKHIENCVVYTGTHDNNTLIGWRDELNDHDRRFAMEYVGLDESEWWKLPWALIRVAFWSRAETVIVPMQDYLELGGDCRINTPSTVGENWKWRMFADEFRWDLQQRIKRMTWTYGRSTRWGLEQWKNLQGEEESTEENA